MIKEAVGECVNHVDSDSAHEHHNSQLTAPQWFHLQKVGAAYH